MMLESMRGAFFRLASYLVMTFLYVYFMELYAPGGLGWRDYHSFRIFNSIEYLRLNRYFTDFGFSIWTSCQNCDLGSSSWSDKIYLSQPALFQFWPYITVNHLFGRDAFLFLGPIIDKSVVFFTAVIVAELFVRFTYRAEGNELSDPLRKSMNTALPASWLGLMVFTVYVSSIWSYQMQRAVWNESWFFTLLQLFSPDPFCGGSSYLDIRNKSRLKMNSSRAVNKR